MRRIKGLFLLSGQEENAFRIDFFILGDQGFDDGEGGLALFARDFPEQPQPGCFFGINCNGIVLRWPRASFARNCATKCFMGKAEKWGERFTFVLR